MFLYASHPYLIGLELFRNGIYAFSSSYLLMHQNTKTGCTETPVASLLQITIDSIRKILFFSNAEYQTGKPCLHSNGELNVFIPYTMRSPSIGIIKLHKLLNSRPLETWSPLPPKHSYSNDSSARCWRWHMFSFLWNILPWLPNKIITK